jgi:predicted  nucleic acid-binding Zn-ribbon protein
MLVEKTVRCLNCGLRTTVKAINEEVIEKYWVCRCGKRRFVFEDSEKEVIEERKKVDVRDVLAELEHTITEYLREELEEREGFITTDDVDRIVPDILAKVEDALTKFGLVEKRTGGGK